MKKTGFTLAEVLITLTIIGVIAAITIPNLMHKYEQHVYEVKIKKFVAQLANNVKMVMAESNCGNISCALTENGISYGSSGVSNGEGQQAAIKIFFKNVQSDIGNNKCTYYDTNIYYLDGTKVQKTCGPLLGCIHQRTPVCVDDSIGIVQTNESFRESYAGSCTNVNTRNNWNSYDIRGICAHFIVFLDGKSRKPVVGKNVFGVGFRADGTIASTTYKMTKDDARKYPLKSLFYLQQNNWQMDYLE